MGKLIIRFCFNFFFSRCQFLVLDSIISFYFNFTMIMGYSMVDLQAVISTRIFAWTGHEMASSKSDYSSCSHVTLFFLGMAWDASLKIVPQFRTKNSHAHVLCLKQTSIKHINKNNKFSCRLGWEIRKFAALLTNQTKTTVRLAARDTRLAARNYSFAGTIQFDYFIYSTF